MRKLSRKINRHSALGLVLSELSQGKTNPSRRPLAPPTKAQFAVSRQEPGLVMYDELSQLSQTKSSAIISAVLAGFTSFLRFGGKKIPMNSARTVA